MFPPVGGNSRFATLETEALCQFLGGLRERRASYAAIRDDYCAAHIELNRRLRDGVSVAPRFRPLIRPTPVTGQGYGPDERAMSNDNQVIDIHWLFMRGHEAVADRRAIGFFSGEVPDVQSFSTFAETVGDTTRKCGILELSRHDQLECSTLQDGEIRDVYKGLPGEVSKVRLQLRSRARRTHQIRGYVQEWTDLFRAVRLEQIASQQGTVPPPSVVAEWYGLVTGSRMSRQRARTKLRALARHIDLRNGH